MQSNEKHGKVVRGFSTVDPDLVSQLHTDIKTKGKEQETNDSYGYNFREVAKFNFTLPDFTQFDHAFVQFLMKDLVENSSLKALEQSGHLNWWTRSGRLQRLYPLLTSGDGNCLLHAASLGIWGVHDRLLNLRQAVYHMLSSELAEKTLKRRWLWYEWVKYLQEGLVLSADEWEAEWKAVLNMADATPRSPWQLATVIEGSAVENEETAEVTRKVSNSWQPRYESLEEIHICSLAHVLRRPIIVVSDSWVYDFQGNPMSPIPFAGVYLPVECDPSQCCREPLVLAYSSSHFSPVVSTQPWDEPSSIRKESSMNHEEINLESQSKPEKSSSECQSSPTKFDSESQSSPSKNNCGMKSSPTKSNPLPNIKSAIIRNPSKLNNAKTSDNANTSTGIQAAVTSIYQVTKSTILQAAKSLTSSNSSTKLDQSSIAAIPLVDKDLKTLPLPFAADPGPNWDCLKQENSEEIVKAKSLTDEERMSLLKRYLDVVEVNVECSGNNETLQLRTVPVAMLPSDNQPSFYKQVIVGYLEKARERFEFEEETKILDVKHSPESLRCANDGCDLYGTVANNYLCTKCFQLQTKSVDQFKHPPPYNPPSYSDTVAQDSPSFAGRSSHTENNTTLKELSVQCRAPGCTFYGTPSKNGFCSKCYNEKNKK